MLQNFRFISANLRVESVHQLDQGEILDRSCVKAWVVWFRGRTDHSLRANRLTDRRKFPYQLLRDGIQIPAPCIKNVLGFRLHTRATRDIRVHIRMVSRPSHRAQNDLTDVSMARDGCDKPKLSDCDKEERGGSNSRHKHLVRDRSSPDQGQTIDSILAHK